MTMEYHNHSMKNGQYSHRHEGWEEPHDHDEVREGTIVGIGMAQERNTGRREEVKRG